MRSVIVGQSKRLGLSSITGVVYDDAPRVRSMLAQGYEFYKPPEHWDCEARLAANPIIISMPASAFSGALQTIEAQAGEAIATCEFDMKKIVLSFNQEAVRMRADFEGRVANSLDGVKLRSKPVAS